MKKSVTKTINYPRALYVTLRDEAIRRDMTNREQVREAVKKHLDEVLKLMSDAGLAAAEDARYPVRCAIDIEVNEHLQGVAEKLGLDYSAILIACLRRQYKLRLNDKAGKQLRAEAASKEDPKGESDD